QSYEESAHRPGKKKGNGGEKLRDRLDLLLVRHFAPEVAGPGFRLPGVSAGQRLLIKSNRFCDLMKGGFAAVKPAKVRVGNAS
ncbi:MAG: hypothetical protein PVG78_19205, partial [Desulfobacterales bacterium]